MADVDASLVGGVETLRRVLKGGSFHPANGGASGADLRKVDPKA